jgi:hypothetical protein
LTGKLKIVGHNRDLIVDASEPASQGEAMRASLDLDRYAVNM